MHKILASGFVLYPELFTFAAFSFAGSGSQKIKIVYAALAGGYAPLWIAVEEGLGRKYGLDLEAIYAGRTSPGLLLASGDAQYSVQTGFGTVQSYALETKDRVIIASFANTTGTSVFSKAQITKSADLRGKVIGTGRPGAISDVLLRYVVKRRLRLDPTREIKIVPMGEAPNILPALVIDAGVLGTPARLIARKM